MPAAPMARPMTTRPTAMTRFVAEGFMGSTLLSFGPAALIPNRAGLTGDDRRMGGADLADGGVGILREADAGVGAEKRNWLRAGQHVLDMLLAHHRAVVPLCPQVRNHLPHAPHPPLRAPWAASPHHQLVHQLLEAVVVWPA